MADDKRDGLDSPGTVKKLLRFFYGACALVLLLDFVLTRKVAHDFESLPGFYAVYGFVCCVVLVLIAKWMRKFLMRDEDYYSDEYDQCDECDKGDEELKERSDVD